MAETRTRRGPNPRFTERMAFAASPELVTELERVAEERQVSMSAVIREYLTRQLQAERVPA